MSEWMSETLEYCPHVERDTGSQARTQGYHGLLLRRIRESDLFESFREAFQHAMGLPLSLLTPGRLSNGGPTPNDPDTVPVRVGGGVVAYLATWQTAARPERTDSTEWPGAESAHAEADRHENKKRKSIPVDGVVTGDRYKAALTLLELFADQLAHLAQELETMGSNSEPPGLVRARRFIHEHLTDPLPLSLVAHQAAMSESHFCRLFKAHFGITFTEYVANCRVARAKRELLRSALRVSEVAFMVGFRSLSQFNRSFARFVGCAPSKYRAVRNGEPQKVSA